MSEPWTNEQIGNVSRLYVSAWIGNSLLMLDPQVMPIYKQRLAWELCQEAHTFAVEVHPDDVRFVETEEEFRTMVRAYWSPTTNTIELHGGPHDGRVIEVPRPGDPWRVPNPNPSPTVADLDAVVTPTMTGLYTEYVRVGWREDARRWVYAPA